MTIKDMEAKSGVSRANIRYYEAEGLLHPARAENGYRSYCEADAAALRKIRLLRSLDLPIDAIRRVQAGEVSLPEVLESHLHTLDAQADTVRLHSRVTQQILSAETDYDSLDADTFLSMLDSSGKDLKADAPPRYNLPWRRLFARDLDFVLCGVLLFVLDIQASQLLLNLFQLLCLLLLEPAFLHWFGTTPGKLIFGIRVTASDGSRLTYTDALERTWKVLWEGEGLRIPLVSLYFHYKSYTAATEGRTLPWEEDTDLTFTDDGRWRFWLLAVAYLAISAVLLLTGG